MREWDVPVAAVTPEPSTWREILSAVAGRSEKSVAVQEYGEHSQNLIEGLRAQGRTVTAVPVYQWRFPDDLAPLRESVRRLLAGEVRCRAVHHLHPGRTFAADCGAEPRERSDRCGIEQSVRGFDRAYLLRGSPRARNCSRDGTIAPENGPAGSGSGAGVRGGEGFLVRTTQNHKPSREREQPRTVRSIR